MRVIVTGGAGFIGSNVVDHLVGQGCEVIVIDDLSSGDPSFVHKQATLHILDIATEAASELVQQVQPDAVIHFAAQIDVRKSISAPRVDANINVLGTLNMLHAAQLAKVGSFISISSGGAVYGDSSELPTTEDAPIAPLSPYGASKYCSEIYLDWASRTSDLRCISLRLSNVYGPRQSLHGEAGVVAIFSKKLLANHPPLIFGDGLQTRDFIFVQDVCTAVYASLTHPTAQGSFNIGTGIQTSVVELVDTLQSATRATCDVRYISAIAGEVRHSALSWGKAKTTLGWEPKTDLQNGVAQTVEFFRNATRPRTQAHVPASRETRYDQA